MSFLYWLAFALFTSVFSLFAQYQLNLDARQTGYVLAYVGLLVALVQGVAVGPITKRFPERWIILITTAVLAVALAAWAITGSVGVLLIVLIPLSLASGLLNTLLRSTLTKTVQKEEVGGILGLSSALESATRVIAPTAGGLLLGGLGNWAPGLAGALIMAGVIVLAWVQLVREPRSA